MELRLPLLFALGCSSCLFVYSTSEEDGGGGTSDGGSSQGAGDVGASDQGGGGADSSVAIYQLSGRGFALAVAPSHRVVALVGTAVPDSLDYLSTDRNVTTVSAGATVASSVTWSGDGSLLPRSTVSRPQTPLLRCDASTCTDWTRAAGIDEYAALSNVDDQILALRREGGLDILNSNGDLATHLDGTGEGAAVASGTCAGAARIAWTTRTGASNGIVWVVDGDRGKFGDPESVQVELVPGSASVGADCTVYFAAADSATSTYYRLEQGNTSPTPLPIAGPLEAYVAVGPAQLWATTGSASSRITVVSCSLAALDQCESAPVECDSIGGIAADGEDVWFTCDDQLVRWSPHKA